MSVPRPQSDDCICNRFGYHAGASSGQRLLAVSVFQRIICITFYLLSALLAVVIISNASAAADDYGALYEHFSPSNRADNKLKSVLEALTFGLYGGASRADNEIEAIVASAQGHERRANASAWLLLGLSVVFVAWRSLRARRPGPCVIRTLTAHVLGVSLVFLIVGLLAPILSLVAYTELAVLGRVVFRYESKGILTTVLELVGSGNLFIAAVLFLFSVVTPAIKLILAFMAIESPHLEGRNRYVGFISIIGKWSMADVLVVAILLAYFITGSDGFSDSWLGPGLYFFAGYCLLSLTAVQLIMHLPKGNASPAPPTSE